MKLYIEEASGLKVIKERVRGIFNIFKEVLPSGMDASIVLKPNFNANMNALTGNTTDLRLIAAVVEELKGRGYTNIKICEGTNSGYYRSNISVISRLMVDALAERLGIEVADLNYSKPREIEFEDGVKASVAADVVDAALLINMPKLKTHFEAGMSVCLKNLMGTLIGQENKKKTHKSLAKNILNINKYVVPHLHIVDALISMEGLGPTRGTPKRTDLLIAGTDPVAVDLLCARVAEFDYKKVRTLKTLDDAGKISKEVKSAVEEVELDGKHWRFKEPIANAFATFIHSPKRQKYFLAIRNTPLFTFLCSTEFVGKLLFKSGLRQDNFIKDEMRFDGFVFHKDKCVVGCNRCADYCPVGLDIPKVLEDPDNGCIGCQYCFLVCPTKAIEFKGVLGFLEEQLRQYDEITREVA